ncbi:myosin-2 essential light chain [Ditylenchus destructor]|uniref:Myosin-2 essential light chain n=1 Tax=Ditylenchus destructor TaxID=166010 RepID=A0AAD4QZU7_9BILA|nr:myosin-2 essential light chain [Ditylenchus destructor]
MAVLCAAFSGAIEIKETTLDQLDQIKEKVTAEIYFHENPIDNATKEMFKKFERLNFVKQLYTIKVEKDTLIQTYTQKFDNEVTFDHSISWKLTGSKLPVLVLMEKGKVVKIHEDMKQLESKAATYIARITELSGPNQAQAGNDSMKNIYKGKFVPPGMPLLSHRIVEHFHSAIFASLLSSAANKRISIVPLNNRLMMSDFREAILIMPSDRPRMNNKADEQLAECREIFCYFDTRGDEKINVKQVGDVLRSLGQNPTEAEIRQCCDHWTDPETRITFEEFVPIYQTVNKTRNTHSMDQFIEGLSHFDREGNGTIAVAELRHLLTTLGEKLNDEEVDQLLNGHEDANGYVNISDFVRTVIQS